MSLGRRFVAAALVAIASWAGSASADPRPRTVAVEGGSVARGSREKTAVREPAAVVPSGSSAVVLFVDADDDDDNGLADRLEGEARASSSVDVHWLTAPGSGAHRVRAIRGGAVRVLAGKQSYTEASRLDLAQAAKRVGLQGIAPGAAVVELEHGRVETRVYELMAFDGEGKRVDIASSHASLSRTIPSSLLPREARGSERDALRWLVVGPNGEMPTSLSFVSTSADGQPIDGLENVELEQSPCPPGTEPTLACRATRLIRATTDWLDRSHPRARELSLRAEVGGRLVVLSGGTKASSIRVGGPRESRLGPLARYRGVLRVRVLRTGEGGGASVGGDAAGAFELAQREVESANAVWGQCGINFGDPRELDVQVVDPPPPHLFAVGCGLGLPAGGGRITLLVDGRRLEIPTSPGEAPDAVARRIAERLVRAGFRATLSTNPKLSYAANASVDVVVRGSRGEYVPLDLVHEAGAERRLGVCLGAVNLADGLSHFTDADAAAGTLEERTLLRAIADDDPTTIDVLIVPYFVTVGRIGESFVDAQGLGVRNAIILDRAGIRAGRRSFALAHELGHVLLNMAGHPDDFGSDQPWSLMDADAADPTIFGPRRLSVDECERAILQSGPGSSLAVLRRWPLFSPPQGALGEQEEARGGAAGR